MYIARKGTPNATTRLASDCGSASRKPILKPHPEIIHHQRLDIMAVRTHGDINLYVVCI